MNKAFSALMVSAFLMTGGVALAKATPKPHMTTHHVMTHHMTTHHMTTHRMSAPKPKVAPKGHMAPKPTKTHKP